MTAPHALRREPEPDRLAALVAAALTELPVADALAPASFTTAAVRYILSWLNVRVGQNLSSAPPVLFIHSRNLERDGEQLGYTRVSHFARDPRRNVLGRVILCSASAQEAYEGPQAAVLLQDAIGAATAAGLGRDPAVIFNPCSSTVTLCPAGLLAADAACDLTVSATPVAVTETTVDAFLDEFHRIYLRNPQSFRSFWKTPSRYVPVPRAEQEVQKCLVPMAMLHFRESTVRSEDHTQWGRADLTIGPHMDGSGAPGSCVLELKVLRTRFHSADGQGSTCTQEKNEESITDGIDQAARYRDARHADLAFLCCYDFRSNNDRTLVDAHADTAAQNDVLPRHYPVHNSARAARRARADSAYQTSHAAGRSVTPRRSRRTPPPSPTVGKRGTDAPAKTARKAATKRGRKTATKRAR